MSFSVNPGTLLKIATDYVTDPIDGDPNAHRQLVRAQNVYGDSLFANGTSAAKVALSSPPAALTANTETTFTFSSQVHHVEIWNKSAVGLYFELDATVTLGSPLLTAGDRIMYDGPATVVRLLSVPATNVNGTSDGNIVLKGWG